ncbi:hypothetical protein [Devriesea agamarum]|uniref:hypothetical protein n=1 Tax=Devriesea agamarum TaxID=472569 RepID=UPI0012ECF9BA|nr:hypothetical protein [Devriesea agamarum]
MAASSTPKTPMAPWATPTLDGPTDLGPPAASAKDQAEAIAAAMATMQAFTAHPSTDAQWWEGLAPHLTPPAQQVWRYTLPSKIPASQVHQARVVSVSAVTADLDVHTDAGVYEVTLVRDQPSDPWLTSAITPPQESMR